MARLKVKQISDFDQKVNSLITAGTTDEAASIDSLESLASSNFATVSDALSAEIDATSGDVKVLSDALSAEIIATSGDVSSIDLVLGAAGTAADVTAISDALTAEISNTNSDVASIDTRAGEVEGDITDVSNAVSEIGRAHV